MTSQRLAAYNNICIYPNVWIWTAKENAPNQQNPNKTMNDFDELSPSCERSMDARFLRILRMRALAHTHATHVVLLSMHTEKKVCVRDREINVDILLFIVVDFSGFLRRRSPDLCQQVSLYACVHYRTRTRITDKTLCIALHWIALYFRGWISINTQYTHTHTERANLFNFDFNFNSSFSPSLFFPYSISVSFHSLQ